MNCLLDTVTYICLHAPFIRTFTFSTWANLTLLVIQRKKNDLSLNFAIYRMSMSCHCYELVFAFLLNFHFLRAKVMERPRWRMKGFYHIRVSIFLLKMFLTHFYLWPIVSLCSKPTVKLLEGPKTYMYCTFHEFRGSFRLCFTCCYL